MYISNLKRFIKYFGKGRKLKFAILFLMSFVAGMFEFLGVALIFPFVKFMINPEEISRFVTAHKMSFLAGFSDIRLALMLGVLLLLFFIAKNLYMVLYLFVQSNFLQKWTRHINNVFVSYYLYAPYNRILKLSAADKIYAITTLSEQATNSFLMRIMSFVTNTFIVVVVLGLIIWKFPVAGTISFTFAVTCVLLQNICFKNKIRKLGFDLQNISKQLNSTNLVTINNIKDIKIMNCENKFYGDFCNIGKKYCEAFSMQVFWNGLPPYMVETIVVITLLLLGGGIVFRSVNQSSVLIASFAMLVGAIFRIAPALNRIQSALLGLPIGLNFVSELNNLYETCKIGDFKFEPEKTSGKLTFRDKIQLQDICFAYEENKPVLNNISLEINKNDFIGIIGLSGAGKTTLADILTGLLQPDSGTILVDDNLITEDNVSAFRKNIGYVQQELTVLEKSFRENVTWGIPEDEIDDNKVLHLLTQVQLGDVIAGYEDGIYAVPFVGENGLSRGQKQRLAIARALYRDPDILIFDEATSALDVKVEADITDMLLKVGKDKTIIAIAHRLSTLKACNKLVYLKDGVLVDTGSFEDLSLKYPDFAELVRLSSLKNKNKKKTLQ